MKNDVKGSRLLLSFFLVMLVASCDRKDQVKPDMQDTTKLLGVTPMPPQGLPHALTPAISPDESESEFSSRGRTSADQLLARSNGLKISAGEWAHILTTTTSGWDYSATYKGQIYRYGNGDIDLYAYNYIDNGWVYVGGTSGSGNPKVFTFRMVPGQSTYLWAYCRPGKLTFDAALYKSTNFSEPFPVTALTSKNSDSPYATTMNAFKGDLVGQCTWGTYGRVQELVAMGHLDGSVGQRMFDAL